MKAHTGCNAVMIGRAAIANPWIFSRLDREQVAPAQVHQIVRTHLERNIQFYGLEDGQRLFRKHAVQYLLMKKLDREDRKKILQRTPPDEFLAMLDKIYAPAL
jgi:tRNA-dihydrouridine synthase